MMWEPTLDVTIEHHDCDDRHVEIGVYASGVVPPSDMQLDEWERQLPRVTAMRRYMAGVLARLALALSEPLAVTAVAHRCGQKPASVHEWRSKPAVPLPGEVLRRYRDELDASGLGRELIRAYEAESFRCVRWPGESDYGGGCGVTGNSLVTPAPPADPSESEGPEFWLNVPNWQGGRDVKWWIERVGQVLDEIRADS